MVKDILIDETGDLAVGTDGDLVVSAADDQHIYFVVISDTGQWKRAIMIGVGIYQWRNAPVTSASVISLRKKIKMQLEYDRAQVNDVRTDGNWNVRIKAEY